MLIKELLSTFPFEKPHQWLFIPAIAFRNRVVYCKLLPLLSSPNRARQSGARSSAKRGRLEHFNTYLSKQDLDRFLNYTFKRSLLEEVA